MTSYTFTISAPNIVLTPAQNNGNVYFAGILLETEGNGVSTDRLGSVRNGGSGSLGYQAEYPYGIEYSLTANDREKYATYTRDSVSGLDYAVNRYYFSQWGRFISPDPYTRSLVLTNPLSSNRYAYTLDDPVNGNDPTGYCTDDGSGDDNGDDPDSGDGSGVDAAGSGSGDDGGDGGDTNDITPQPIQGDHDDVTRLGRGTISGRSNRRRSGLRGKDKCPWNAPAPPPPTTIGPAPTPTAPTPPTFTQCVASPGFSILLYQVSLSNYQSTQDFQGGGGGVLTVYSPNGNYQYGTISGYNFVSGLALGFDYGAALATCLTLGGQH